MIYSDRDGYLGPEVPTMRTLEAGGMWIAIGGLFYYGIERKIVDMEFYGIGITIKSEPRTVYDVLIFELNRDRELRQCGQMVVTVEGWQGLIAVQRGEE